MGARKIKKEKTSNVKKEKVINLEKEYTDLKKSGSFSGAKSFYRELKKKNKNIKKYSSTKSRPPKKKCCAQGWSKGIPLSLLLLLLF